MEGWRKSQQACKVAAHWDCKQITTSSDFGGKTSLPLCVVQQKIKYQKGIVLKVLKLIGGSQVAERLGNRAINQKVASSIPGCVKGCCVIGQGTSPYLPRGNVHVLTVSRSG